METAMPRLSTTRKELLTAMMKDAIYEAAISVLAEHGVEGMTMDRVAAAANVAKGSLYSYFEGKQDLLQFVHAKTIDPIIEAIDGVIRAEMPATAKLEAILHIVFDQLAKLHALFSLLAKDDAVRVLLEPSRRTTHEIAVGQYALIFRQGIDEGVFRPFDPMQLAEMFFGAMTELWHRSLASGEFRQTDLLIDTLLSVFVHGVAVGNRP
jgi:TetR/AcrR family transcriptional regulator